LIIIIIIIIIINTNNRATLFITRYQIHFLFYKKTFIRRSISIL